MKRHRRLPDIQSALRAFLEEPPAMESRCNRKQAGSDKPERCSDTAPDRPATPGNDDEEDRHGNENQAKKQTYSHCFPLLSYLKVHHFINDW
jgi:hypothetical protein